MKPLIKFLWTIIIRICGLYEFEIARNGLDSFIYFLRDLQIDWKRVKDHNRALLEENSRIKIDLEQLKTKNNVIISDDLIKENSFYRSKYDFLNSKISHLTSELLRYSGIKVILGASGVYQAGWIPLDEDQMDISIASNWDKMFREESVSCFLAEHVWEHLTYEEGMVAAQKIYSRLKKGGYLRLAVPDGFHSNPEYIDAVKPGGNGDGSGDHKILFNYKIMEKLLKESGFQTIKFLEFFDENHIFHYEEWNPEDGMIHRSAKYDERNTNASLKYTSLIVDAIK